MNFLQKRFIKIILEEDFDWLTDVSKQLSDYLTIKHTKSFDAMKKEIVAFIDGKRDKVSEETAEFASAFLIYDAKYLKDISERVGPKFAVWILSRVLLLSMKPVWVMLVDYQKGLRPFFRSEWTANI